MPSRKKSLPDGVRLETLTHRELLARSRRVMRQWEDRDWDDIARMPAVWREEYRALWIEGRRRGEQLTFF